MTYWSKRQQKTLDAISDKSIKDINKQLQRYYGKAAQKVISDFMRTHDKLRATVAEGKEPTPADLYKLDKYWQMQAQMRQELQRLGEKTISTLTKAFEYNYYDIYYSINLPIESEAFNRIDKQAVMQMINEIWCADGKSWSQRVWDNTDKLADTLNTELIHIVASGKKNKDIKNLLQEKFNVSYYRANTIVRTEVAHVQTQAAIQRYKDYGLERYEIMGNGDENCGQRKGVNCHELDGKVFHLSEIVVGQNAPPFHPNCKCAILPIID